MSRQAHVLAVLATLVAALAGCGSSSSSATKPDLIVSAAASLKPPFSAYGQQLSDAGISNVHYSFAGSDQLAAQIQQGVRPDLFASANLKLPTMLYAQGLVGRPVTFATNRLVLAVPASSSKVSSLDDLRKGGVTIAIGSATVPIGSYTRAVLRRVSPAQQRQIMANVRSDEPDVTGIVGKLTQGAAEAGFVYVTDVDATKGALRAIELPASLQPQVAYGVAIVKGTSHLALAQQFIAGLLSGPGQADLRMAGFGPPVTFVKAAAANKKNR